ncbi:MAG: septal ring lytic transglycosylase RlpA family protein [Alphaproteobacteria bacterium]|nr:septal ring lytic transglycosylase RlpA family protein [Alphaproteobacteria bacterium]
MHFRLLISLLSLLILSACAQTQFASHIIKQSLPEASKSEGSFKVGSSYKVAGKRYTPKETYSYTETGIASWYGSNFHGKSTANGEIFDMNELTAAHKTLQLPSLVRVTNLENGRSLIVRINDRGPFKRGRIIDLSKRSAELLGFKNKGTAKVKVKVLGKESRVIAQAAKRGQSTRGVEIAMNENTHNISKRVNLLNKKLASTNTKPVIPIDSTQDASLHVIERQSLDLIQIPGSFKSGNFMPDPVVRQLPVTQTNIYVQVGSFGDQNNAIKLAQSLQSTEHAKIYPAIVNEKQFYRVRLGPIDSITKADFVLENIVEAGCNEAIIVVD